MREGRGDEVREASGQGLVEPVSHCQKLGFYPECDTVAETVGKWQQTRCPACSLTYP